MGYLFLLCFRTSSELQCCAAASEVSPSHSQSAHCRDPAGDPGLHQGGGGEVEEERCGVAGTDHEVEIFWDLH